MSLETHPYAALCLLVVLGLYWCKWEETQAFSPLFLPQICRLIISDWHPPPPPPQLSQPYTKSCHTEPWNISHFQPFFILSSKRVLSAALFKFLPHEQTQQLSPLLCSSTVCWHKAFIPRLMIPSSLLSPHKGLKKKSTTQNPTCRKRTLEDPRQAGKLVCTQRRHLHRKWVNAPDNQNLHKHNYWTNFACPNGVFLNAVDAEAYFPDWKTCLKVLRDII